MPSEATGTLAWMHTGLRRVVGAIGRAAMTLGVIILLFVAYGLWGTGFLASRDQAKLDDEFAAARAAFLEAQDEPAPTTTPPGTSPTGPTTATTSVSTPPQDGNAVDIDLTDIADGDAIGRIRIPKIGVDWTFVQGTTRDELKKGPGHYTGTPYPGQIGNAAIAGHRTTYGAPFNRIDELEPQNLVHIETFWGNFTYQVYCEVIVRPQDTWVAGSPADCQQRARPAGVAEITLTSCNPKFSARERYVVKAVLLVDQSDRPARFDPSQLPQGEFTLAGEDNEFGGTIFAGDDVLREGLAGDPAALRPALAWAGVVTIVGLLWWFAFRRYRHWATWVAGLVPFAAVLLGCFFFVERALPAGI